MDLENSTIFQLPSELIIQVLKNCTFQECYKVRLTCKTLKKLIEENLKYLASTEIYHIDLARRRVRAWRNFSWCDPIPFESIEYISKFFCFVNVKVLTVNKLDEELCAFLTENAQKNMLRFEQLRLFHSFSASHESICQLLLAAKCRVINFEAAESNLQPINFELEGFKKLNSLCFEMDDSIDEEFYDSILNNCQAKKFIFHSCDKIPQRFVRNMFEQWLIGSRELEAVRITTNQNFNFGDIISGLNIQNVDSSTWTMKNVKEDKATITMRRNNFHFFVAFEVNDHHIEDILYKIPFIE
ncbi:hypothetical protein CRE_10898 [Caenorhabditis remanei]|uniref:F-box domain-containing protein n=1 Tax=Caenorhabditis remanei TaxID=31234 RepID=E3M5E6_CAERE|nr:hypothetical protein CRE_10898 [Caenorhabditis remanei]